MPFLGGSSWSFLAGSPPRVLLWCSVFHNPISGHGTLQPDLEAKHRSLAAVVWFRHASSERRCCHMRVCLQLLCSLTPSRWATNGRSSATYRTTARKHKRRLPHANVGGVTVTGQSVCRHEPRKHKYGLSKGGDVLARKRAQSLPIL